MMESLRRERQTSFDYNLNQPRSAVRRHGAAAAVRSLDLTAQRWTADVPRTRPAPHRPVVSHIALLTAIRRIAIAIQEWRQRARSERQLSRLGDHMLKDIGLRREEVGYQFARPFLLFD